jgi:large subunit ribosomal protein L32e
MPNTGYGSNKKTKHVLPSGFRKFLVHNVKEPEVLLMLNESYCAEVKHSVFSKNQKAITESSTAGHQNHQSQCQATQQRK